MKTVSEKTTKAKQSEENIEAKQTQKLDKDVKKAQKKSKKGNRDDKKKATEKVFVDQLFGKAKKNKQKVEKQEKEQQEQEDKLIQQRKNIMNKAKKDAEK